MKDDCGAYGLYVGCTGRGARGKERKLQSYEPSSFRVGKAKYHYYKLSSWITTGGSATG